MKNNILGYWVIILSHLSNLLPILLAVNRPLPNIYKATIILQTIFSVIYHAFPNKEDQDSLIGFCNYSYNFEFVYLYKLQFSRRN